MNARTTLIRFSIVLNAFLIFYICVNWTGSNEGLSEPPDRASALQQSRNLESLGTYFLKNSEPSTRTKENEIHMTDEIIELGDIGGSDKVADEIKPEDTPLLQEPPRFVQESMGVTENLQSAVIATDAPDPPLDSLERKMYPDLRDCVTKPALPFASQRGSYWVLENYIPAAMSFRCDESITYTTHGDFTFLDNLEILTSRWQGPVSMGVYAPGEDFKATVDTILYLRNCWGEGIKKYVTFHLIYHTNHIPAKIPSTDELLQRKVDCSIEPPKWVDVTTYKQKKRLLYPINIARNIARRASSTYFVFPSDVELYPSVNFIPDFFKMLKKPDVSNSTNPRVYVFSIFEVKEKLNPPETKPELIKMLTSGDAIPFHKKVCAACHKIPHSKEWLEEPINPGLSVVYSGKRQGNFKKWEPIYVGTNKEPQYDERLSWEGKSDKMTQMYVLCVRDYEFHILDNAFLVHRPGIKVNKKETLRMQIAKNQTTLIHKHIVPEYKRLFGSKKECTV